MKTYKCLGCGKDSIFDHRKTNKYCSNVCQGIVTRRESYERLLRGELTDRGTIRKAIVQKEGHKCQSCGLTEWMGKPIPLELDHIDGDASNNDISNLRVICANCHGVTDTWKGRNRGNGRKARGLALS